jgi:hypothetical protein
MKKLLVLAAVLLLIVPATAMAGMTAFMDMDELSSNELADTTGQAGITLRTTLTIVTGGYIGWGDDDGCTTTVNATNQGWLTLSSIWSDGVTLTDVTIDVCSNEAGDQWVVIAVPTLTLNQGVRAIKVGSLINTDDSMGELQIVNLSLAAMTIHVRGH